MSLISCPECNKEVSDKSKSCIHCGYPLDEFKLKKVVIFDMKDNKPEYNNALQKCYEYLRVLFQNLDDWFEVLKPYNQEPPKPVIITDLSMEEANEIYNKINEIGGECDVYSIDDDSYKLRAVKSTITSYLRCPVCKSYDIDKIGVLSRGLSTSLLGLASSSIGKQYRCKKCNHKW